MRTRKIMQRRRGLLEPETTSTQASKAPRRLWPAAAKKEERVFALFVFGLVACCLQSFLVLTHVPEPKGPPEPEGQPDKEEEGDWVYLPVKSSGTTAHKGTLFKLQHLEIPSDSESPYYNGFPRQRRGAHHKAEILILAPSDGADFRHDVLFSDFRGGFELSNNKARSYLLPWESPHGATPLWIVTYGEDNVSMYVRYLQKRQQQEKAPEFYNSTTDSSSCEQRRQLAAVIPPEEMEYPHRRPFVRSRQQQQTHGKVTVCTQLTVDRLPRLAALATNFAGPISAVVYVGFRTGNRTQETAEAIRLWENSESMKKHVDLHLVMDEQHPWYATGKTRAGHGSNPYPVNVLRQLAVEYAQSEWVLYLEADMITNPNAYGRIIDRWEAMMVVAQEHNRTAFVVPVYSLAVNDTSSEGVQDLTRNVPPNKEALRSIVSERDGLRRMGDIYASHKDVDYIHWEKMDSGEFLPLIHKEKYFEPYFLVQKSFMPPYEVLFWGMLNDKRQQVTDMLNCNFRFVHHPDLFAVHLDSPGLGDGWIVAKNQQTWRVAWARNMHKLLASKNEMC